MQLNKGDIIKDGEGYFSVFCVMCSVIYVQRVSSIEKEACYELAQILKHYRKFNLWEMVKKND